MKIASVGEIKTQFSAYLRATEQGPVVVTRNGKPVAVLLAMSDEDELERLVFAHAPGLRSVFQAAHERIQAGEGIPHEVFWQEMEAENRPPKRGKAREKTA